MQLIVKKSSLKRSATDEQNYFLRYEVMRSLLLEKYPKTDASLLDHIIETIYDKIFLA